MIAQANALTIPLADKSAQVCVTSPPYLGLRDYNIPGQLGLEPTVAEYVANQVAVAREVWRVLRDDGTFFLNLGDTYGTGTTAGRPKKGSRGLGENTMAAQNSVARVGGMAKQLFMIPARVALALQADGWYLRAEIVWAKLNPMPESVTDRPTRSHEMIYLFTKKPRYYYDAMAVREKSSGEIGGRFGSYPNETMRNDGERERPEDNGSRNQRDVWVLATEPYSGAHYATFCTEIPRRAILAGTSAKGHCARCGKGWVRVVEKSGGTTGKSWHNHENDLVDGQSKARLDGDDYRVKTLGWQPVCKCNADVIPAIILDPFCGSGTTGQIARELGRRFVGLDLSMRYLRENALPRAERKQTAESIASLPLFGGNGHG